MDFVSIWSFDNYVSAHIASGRLKEEGIDNWLKDENTVTLDPILTNAVGGIKIMVAESNAKKALGLLNELHQSHKATTPCPRCGSSDIELVTTPRKASNWLSAILGFITFNYAMGAEQVLHCFNCSHEYPQP